MEGSRQEGSERWRFRYMGKRRGDYGGGVVRTGKKQVAGYLSSIKPKLKGTNYSTVKLKYPNMPWKQQKNVEKLC